MLTHSQPQLLLIPKNVPGTSSKLDTSNVLQTVVDFYDGLHTPNEFCAGEPLWVRDKACLAAETFVVQPIIPKPELKLIVNHF